MSFEELDEMLKADNERLQTAREILDPENIIMKTELTDAEIVALRKLKFIGDMFHIDEVEAWIKNFMLMRVSRKRKGREEFIRSIMQPRDDKEDIKFINKL